MVHVIAATHSFPYVSSLCFQGDSHRLQPHAQNIMSLPQQHKVKMHLMAHLIRLAQRRGGGIKMEKAIKACNDESWGKKKS